MGIDVLVPVLQRPESAAPLAESLSVTVTPYRLLFVCSPGDHDQIVACAAVGEVLVVPWAPGRGDYAKKINRAFEETQNEWIFSGADDIRFSAGWDTEALDIAKKTGRRVIGTNDLHNPEVRKGKASTHTLFARSYIEECGGTLDGTGRVFCELYDHQCNPPEAPIWMADTSFKDLDDVRVGDEVMGWERGPRTEGQTGLRKLKPATVTAKGSRWSDIIWVHLESGRSLRCTPDHLWLNPKWFEATGREGEYAIPKVGRYLSHVVEPLQPVPPEHERLAGWLGGIFDGEGAGTSNPLIAHSASHNPAVYNRICEALDFFGFPYTRADDRVWLTGGRYEWMRFLHVAQPTKRIGLIEQVIGSSRFGKRDKIVAIEPDRMGEVQSLTTTTGNYVAWGYASKNCIDLEFIEVARRRGEFMFSRNSIVEHFHPHWGNAQTDRTYRKATRATMADLRLYRERMTPRRQRPVHRRSTRPRA